MHFEVSRTSTVTAWGNHVFLHLQSRSETSSDNDMLYKRIWRKIVANRSRGIGKEYLAGLWGVTASEKCKISKI
jgi:hypothetical protein